MRTIRWAFLALAELASLGCVGGAIPLSAPSTAGDLFVALEANWLGDARLAIVARSSGKREELLTVRFADSNERIAQLGWSSVGDHFAVLVSGSSRYPNGTRLVVLDVRGFAQDGVRRVIDTQEPVASFTFDGHAFVYNSAGERVVQELP